MYAQHAQHALYRRGHGLRHGPRTHCCAAGPPSPHTRATERMLHAAPPKPPRAAPAGGWAGRMALERPRWALEPFFRPGPTHGSSSPKKSLLGPFRPPHAAFRGRAGRCRAVRPSAKPIAPRAGLLVAPARRRPRPAQATGDTPPQAVGSEPVPRSGRAGVPGRAVGLPPAPPPRPAEAGRALRAEALARSAAEAASLPPRERGGGFRVSAGAVI